MRIKILFLLFLLNIYCISGQIKNIGLPFIQNYTKGQYYGGSQTWDMVQDNRGIMYFANNNGVLEFDGVNWRTFPVNNRSVVRSVAIGGDKIIYAGAFNELGYLRKQANGSFYYQSLVDKIPSEYRNFDEIWKIYSTSFGLVFQSFKYIFIYQNEKFTVIKPFSQFGFSFYLKGMYYVVDKEKGILFFESGELKSLANQPEIFMEDEIRFILPFHNTLLIGVLNHGLFILEDGKIKPWESPINNPILNNDVFSAIKMASDHYVFGTISNGLYITDDSGNILQHINRIRGLQNNTILSLYTDKLNNVWCGLDNGITYIETSSPATLINHCFGIETGYVSMIHNNILYLGTNQGLYARELNLLENNSIGDRGFSLIEGTQGQVWTLYPENETLFCGHNNGTFVVDGFTASKISAHRGVWKFIKPKNSINELIAGTYNGLIKFKCDADGKWYFSNTIKGFNESCKNIIEDNDESLLISHGYKGIYRLKLNETKDSVTGVLLYNYSSGLPASLPYEINKLFGQSFVTTVDGCYQYNNINGRYETSLRFNNFFNGNSGISKIFSDSLSNIWYTGAGKMGVYRILEDGNYREVSTPFYKFSNNLLPAFEHIYPYNEKNVFISIQDGFIHYDPTLVKRYNDSYPVFIREVRFLKKNQDSIISYHGDAKKTDNDDNLYVFKYASNSIGFRFAAPFFEDPDKTEYRCRLKGYDNDWGPWETRTMREYTNLHEGNYLFEVQARNIYKTLSNTDTFTFEILPPFHRSLVAYVIYSLFFLTLVIANIILFTRRIERTRKKEQLIHNRKLLAQEQQFREESLIAEKKIEQLKNEKLLAEMKHKNKELANSTMYIIQKNKFLNTLKDELSTILTTVSEGSKSKIKQLLRKIDKDINSEKYFKVFDSYFDDVHQDFLRRLKDKHPELSPKELRLCAYIRMNISSKEIASLLNISIRGVEVSRYRLRKKMSIEHEMNLTEYILNL